MGEKPSKEKQTPAPSEKNFDYGDKILTLHQSAVITKNRYDRYESIDSLTETTIEGKRYIILQSNALIHQHFIIYLDEQFNYVKERMFQLGSDIARWQNGHFRRRMILDEHHILIDTSDGLHLQQNQLSHPLYPFSRVDYYRVLDDGSFQILFNVKKTVKGTGFDFVDFKRSSSFAGFTANVESVPFEIKNVPENLFFVDALNHDILKSYEILNLLVIYVKFDKENNIYHVVVKTLADLLAVHRWSYTGEWNWKLLFYVRAEEYYTLNIYFNEKSIKYQSNKMQFASLVPEVYSDWRREALKLLSETECLRKLATSLLSMVVDYVAS